MEPIIETKNLTKTYQTGRVDVHALRGVDLAFDRGEFVAIMGPSGSGKSTFMNLIGCLDTPTDGTYTLDGFEVSGLTDDELAFVRCTKLGFVFQTFNLLPRTSALLNVELPRFYNWRGMKGRQEEAKRRLSEVGLEDRADHAPNELSGGQQQRVAIARALVNDPDVIFADEPTGALDTRTSEEIMAIFQNLNRQGKTVILVTHEQDIALHASRIVRFRDGEVVSDEKVESPIDARDVLAKMPAARN